MKVLHVMECTIGGTRRHLRDLAAEQLRLGLEVSLIVSVLRDPPFERDLVALEELGVRVHRLPMVREIRLLTDAQHFGAVGRLMKQEAPDICHTHSSKAGVLGRMASIRSGVGTRVHTPHTFAFLFGEMFGVKKRAVFRRIERGLAKRTAAVVAVSEGEAQTFASSGVVPKDRIRVVRNGIFPDPYLSADPVPRADLELPAEVPVATVVGLLNRAKGQDLALRALKDSRLAELHLLIAGHGEDENSLRNLAKSLGVEGRVRFLGWRDDVPRLFAASDFSLLPSRWEAMPYAALEAMAAALPIVATPVDGATDLVEHGRTGFIAEQAEPEALANALSKMLGLSTARRIEFGLLGRARVLEGYTARSMARGLLDVYTSVLP